MLKIVILHSVTIPCKVGFKVTKKSDINTQHIFHKEEVQHGHQKVHFRADFATVQKVDLNALKKLKTKCDPKMSFSGFT